MSASFLRIAAGEAGTALVLNLFALVLFASLAVTVFVGARSQAKTTVWVERQAQAQAIAEAGLEYTLNTLYQNSAWTTGYVNKSFGGGSFTVTVTTYSPTRVTSTGYSASLFGFGAAVRTVSAQVSFTAGSCPYAVMADRGLNVDGSVDGYDPTVTLYPCSTCFTTGANVWNNGNVTVGGAACPPAHIKGIVYAGNGGTGPSASCATGGVVLSTTSVTLPNYDCPSCTSLGNITINNGETVTLTSGTYSYQKMTIKNGGTLRVDTTSGPVTVDFTGNVDFQSGCQVNNTSANPSKFYLADISGHGVGHTVNLNCSTALHAYIEGNDAQFNIQQEVYGHFCGSRVDISSTTGRVGKVHYDIGGGVVSHVTPSSWQETYKRQ